MAKDRACQLWSALAVLLMALGALVGPAGLASAATVAATNNIRILVIDQEANLVITATVTLIEVHTGAVLSAPLVGGWYQATAPPAGYYRVDITAPGYYGGTNIDKFRFEALNTVVRTVTLTKYPSAAYTYKVNVTDGTSRISGATVEFYDDNSGRHLTVASAATNATGVATLQIWGDTTGNLYLVARKSGYELAYSAASVSGDPAITRYADLVIPSSTHRLSGFVFDGNGDVAQNVVAYLVNTASVPTFAKILKVNPVGNLFNFDAYAGTFILVVDGKDQNGLELAAHVGSYVISANAFLSLTLSAAVGTTDAVALDFTAAGTVNGTLQATENIQWAYDRAHPGLDYQDLGSLRLQVDLAFRSDPGWGNGVADATEVAAFVGLLNAASTAGFGPSYVTTDPLLKVNGTAYVSTIGTFVGGSVSGLAGSATDLTTTSYAWGYAVDYAKIGTGPQTNAALYLAAFTARLDAAGVDRSYSLTFASGYELVSNTTQGPLVVSGFLAVTLNPGSAPTGSFVTSATASLTFEKSQTPTAKPALVDDAFVYVKQNATGAPLYYVVQSGKEVSLNGGESTDPNGNPLTYEWVVQSTPIGAATADPITRYTFGGEGNQSVQLTVRDVAGLANIATTYAWVDANDPVAVISVKEGYQPNGSGVAVDQDITIRLNGSASTDLVATGLPGEIAEYNWAWGDGNSTRRTRLDLDKNVSWSYHRAGIYNVTLNVTDLVGRNASVSLWVTVNDSEAPQVRFTVTNATGVLNGNVRENETATLNATTTTDNVGALASLDFRWDFGTTAYLGGPSGTPVRYLNATPGENIVVTLVYKTVTTAKLRLNVTDASGNSQTSSRDLVVNSAPRPNMNVDVVTWNPGKFTEGERGTITVNFTNVGDAPATQITIELFLIEGSSSTRIASTTSAGPIAPNGKGFVVLEWAPSKKGNATVKAVVRAGDQVVPADDLSVVIPVRQAAWKAWALPLGIVGIIIALPLLILLRRRYGGDERLRRRRERDRERERTAKIAERDRRREERRGAPPAAPPPVAPAKAPPKPLAGEEDEEL